MTTESITEGFAVLRLLVAKIMECCNAVYYSNLYNGKIKTLKLISSLYNVTKCWNLSGKTIMPLCINSNLRNAEIKKSVYNFWINPTTFNLHYIDETLYNLTAF